MTDGACRRTRRHRRSGPAERRQHLRPPRLPRARARSAGRCTSTPIPGRWPEPDAAVVRRSRRASCERIPDDAVVLLDGLIASTAPEVLVPQARRLRLVVLVHMPLGHRPAEARPTTLGGANARCSRPPPRWSRPAQWTPASAARALPVARRPGACRRARRRRRRPRDAGPVPGGALLCVAAVTFDKGHDVLLDALAIDVGAVLALRVRRQPRPRLRRSSEIVRRRALDGGLERPRALPGTANRGRSRPQLRRR